MSIDLILQNLLGLQIFVASHAANMREFGLRYPDCDDRSQQPEWYLHLQCSWRLESLSQILTGSLDWFEPADATREMGDDWDPATGGSLQELKIREIFQDYEGGPTIRNLTSKFVVTDVSTNDFGDLTINLSGGVRLNVFPAGSRGEFWRIFKKGDLSSHFVSEGQDAD